MLLIYQIKVGLCLIAFYLLWKLLLSRETFHRFNRVALLVVMVLALVLPWIRLSLDATVQVAKPMVVLEDLLVTPGGAAAAQQTSLSWSVMDFATLAYFIGVAMALAWFLHSHWSLYRLLKQGRRESLPSGITLHVVPGDQSPFSYFKHIVISEQDYRDNPHEILTHEQAHIGLRHSWDVLFMSMVTLFQWWNPAAWLLGRELRLVHEYEADEAVLNQGINAKQYQLLLIRKSVGDKLFSMANNFNYQSLKKRIRMMSMNKSSRWNRLRALAVVPVIALALLAFANNKSVAAVVTAGLQQDRAVQSEIQSPESVQVEAATQPVEAEAATQADDVKTEVKAPEETEPQSKKVYNSVEQMPEFPGGAAAMMRYLQENIKYPPEAAKNNIEGRVIVQFVIDETGQVGEVKVVRPVSEELDAEAVRVVKTFPKFEPGRQDGEAVSVWYTLPIMFKIQAKPMPTPIPQQQEGK
ncbi:MAG: TonB family protein [Muribaculaceae bacterium]|nr:TonB family protein [Muribaculaceae bacterium]